MAGGIAATGAPPAPQSALCSPVQCIIIIVAVLVILIRLALQCSAPPSLAGQSVCLSVFTLFIYGTFATFTLLLLLLLLLLRPLVALEAIDHRLSSEHLLLLLQLVSYCGNQHQQHRQCQVVLCLCTLTSGHRQSVPLAN